LLVVILYLTRTSKNVLNINKSRARVRCFKGENVIVLIKVKELYIASPEN
jgi:hypothetical protein